MRQIDLPPGPGFTARFTGSLTTMPPADQCYGTGGHNGWTEECVVFIQFKTVEDPRPVLEPVGAELAQTSWAEATCNA